MAHRLGGKLTELEKVIRAFVKDGRLTAIPAKPSKRDLLLPWLLDECFPEDRDYEEKEVNQRLALDAPGRVRAARYLIDARLMTRDAGHLPPRSDVADAPRPIPGRSVARGGALTQRFPFERAAFGGPSCTRRR